MKLFTFIATSESLGDIIIQAEGEEMELAWVRWTPEVASVIVERIDKLSTQDTESVAIQIKNEGPIIKRNEIGVWLADLLLDEFEEVIQVLIIDTRREDTEQVAAGNRP